VARLSHERDLLLLLQCASKFYETIGDSKAAAVIACRQLDYLYYKHEATGGGIEAIKLQLDNNDEDPEDEPEVEDAEADSLEEFPEEQEEKEVEKDVVLTPPKNVTPYTNLREIVAKLTSLVYNNSTEDHHKRRVMLQHVYHLALHDQYQQARDMLLMTHLQEKIHRARVTDQIMFNRAMVQLGMAAFRAGRIEDSNNCLQDIIQNGKDKAKELLAQGITRFQGEKNAEQEKQERSRQIPYHMHINLDLIECILLVSGMLLEIPNIAQSRFRESKRKMISKYFRKSFDFYNDRQLFTGPPENTKESVIVAAKHLDRGDWKTTRDMIVGLDIVWKLIPNNESVLSMIGRQIQEQALRTYLFSYAQYYDTIHISKLASMFDLEETAAHALVSNMMMSAELQASFDQPSGAIVVGCQDASSLQYLALNFAEKANILLENNEQIDQRGMYDRRSWTEPGRQGQKPGVFQRGGRVYNSNPYSGTSRPSDRQFTTKRKPGFQRGGLGASRQNK